MREPLFDAMSTCFEIYHNFHKSGINLKSLWHNLGFKIWSHRLGLGSKVSLKDFIFCFSWVYKNRELIMSYFIANFPLIKNLTLWL